MLELVFPIDLWAAKTVAELCLQNIEQKEGGAIREINLYHVPVKTSSLGRRLSGRTSFHIDVGEFDFHFSSVRNHRLAFLSIDGIDEPMTRYWVEAFAKTSSIVSARVYDSEYERWQNAEDPLEFESSGRTLEGVRMISNALPPPLEQMIVDTSMNPGRRVLRDGFVEAVGHRMWLGGEFDARVQGFRRDPLFAASWLHVVELNEGLLELEVSESAFLDSDSAAIQDRLRALLFSQ